MTLRKAQHSTAQHSTAQHSTACLLFVVHHLFAFSYKLLSGLPNQAHSLEGFPLARYEGCQGGDLPEGQHICCPLFCLLQSCVDCLCNIVFALDISVMS